MRKRVGRVNPKLNKPNKRHKRDEPDKLDKPEMGVVKARTCKHCGHHEIGIVTRTGEFIPLKPGMKIAILERSGRLTREEIMRISQFATSSAHTEA